MSKTRLKHLYFGVVVGMFSLCSTSLYANSNCSIELIKTMSFSDQLERYATCIDLMKQEHELIKAQHQIQKMTGEVDASHPASEGLSLPEGLNVPQTPGFNAQTMVTENKYPSVVISVEGVADDLVATLSWTSGRTMMVRKGSYLAKNLKVSNVTITGVELIEGRNKKRPIFIGVGRSGVMSPQGTMQHSYPMQ